MARALGITVEHLRRMERAREITCIRTGGRHRRYDVQSFIDAQTETLLTTIGYCRVSRKGERDDLDSQVRYVQSHYSEAEIIRGFGSGATFKRKGLIALLERLLRGDKLRIVIAHRDRLARFGREVIQFLVEQNGGELVVLDKTVYSPESELTEDFLTILDMFSHRMSRLLRYCEQIKEDRDIPHSCSESGTP